MSLKICSIQNFSLHDGPGIRTTFFLSGCPLSCAWCHNPETQSFKQQILFESRKCINCRQCLICPNNAHRFVEKHLFLRENCGACGMCIEKCPTNALRYTYQIMKTEEIIKIINNQKLFYGNNGGITFSGGEPLIQAEGIISIINSIGVHTAIETCGYVPSDIFQMILEKIDYVMFDIKLINDDFHKKYTGVSNELILENFNILQKSQKSYIVRTPIIPGMTDSAENLTAIHEFIGNSKWEKLKYNTLTPQKYEWLGKEYIRLK